MGSNISGWYCVLALRVADCRARLRIGLRSTRPQLESLGTRVAVQLSTRRVRGFWQSWLRRIGYWTCAASPKSIAMTQTFGLAASDFVGRACSSPTTTCASNVLGF